MEHTAPGTGYLNCLADTERTVARRVRRSLNAERETEVVTPGEVPPAHHGMLVQVLDSRVLDTGEAAGAVDNAVEEAVVPPQGVSALRHHSRIVLGHECSVLPGLATRDMAPEPRIGSLMARSSLLVGRIVQARVKYNLLAQVARTEEALG